MLTMTAHKKPKSAPTGWTPKKLKALRGKLGDITQAQAAALIGISFDTWAAWESGRRTPSAAAQFALRTLANRTS